MREIPLTQDKVAMVDDEDYPLVAAYKWFARSDGYNWYAIKNTRRKDGKRKHMHMHRLICRPPKGMQIDHIDGNGLNNRRCNLRPCTHAQNHTNRKASKHSSQYKGVYRSGKKWKGQVGHEGRQFYLGSYHTEIEAALAYDYIAAYLWGEFAKLNFPTNTGQEGVQHELR